MGVVILGVLVLTVCVTAGVVLIARGLHSGPQHATCGNRACRYDVRGLLPHTDRCPECGARFEEVGITPPGRGRSRPLIIAGLAACLVPAVIGFMMSFVLAHQARREAARAAAAARQQILLLPAQPQAANPNVQLAPGVVSDPETENLLFTDPEEDADRDIEAEDDSD